MPVKSTARSRALPTLNSDESPLAWLARRHDKNGQPLISSAQFLAGEQLRCDFTLAQMTPRVTTNYSGVTSGAAARRSAPGTGIELRDVVVAAGQRVTRALAAVGPELSGVLLDVCCHLKGLEEAERRAAWPQRAGKVVLQLALTRLARHYRFDNDAAQRNPAIRQWGTDDYRPHLDDPGIGPRDRCERK